LGPLLIGAILAGASEEERAKLARFATPLGVAFQLRDDCMGLFAEEVVTGKPKGSDLRHGKRTALVAELSGDTRGEELLARVLGRADAAAADVDAFVAHVLASGARERVEARIAALVGEAKTALSTLRISTSSRSLLAAAADALAHRGA
jgi:geranylgeranyl diphosphate synthase type I